MKKTIKTLVLTLILVLCCGNVFAFAEEDKSSYETPIKKLIEDIGGYEWEALARMQTGGYDLDEVAYGSSKAWMAEVSALSINFVVGEKIRTEEYDYGWTDYYKISAKKLKKQGKNIFGKTITLNDLWFGDRGSMTEAYMTNDDGAVAKFECYETETGIYDRGLTIKKNGKKYTAVKQVFFGYWGEDENGAKANFQITYTFKQSAKSSYGLVLTGMRIKRL